MYVVALGRACLNSGGVLGQAANQAAEACEDAHPALEEDVARVYDGIEQATDEQQKELEARAAAVARRQVGAASDCLPEQLKHCRCALCWPLLRPAASGGSQTSHT
jgi:hypothetical protein